MISQLESPVNIEYDRSAREYRWIDPGSGQVFTSPARQRGELFRFAVSMFDPTLYAAATRLIANNPHLERATWLAAQLVINSSIETFPVAVDGTLAMVESSDGMGRYAVYHDEAGYMACQCESYKSFDAPLTKSGHRLCKHIISFLLYQRTREERF
jgi:hypothetical protein